MKNTILNKKNGSFLVEFIITVTITAMVIGTFTHYFITGIQQLQVYKHRVSAISILHSKLELIKNTNYSNVNVGAYPIVENITLDQGAVDQAEVGANDTQGLPAVMTTDVQICDDAGGGTVGKYITVEMAWTENGRELNERLESIYYDYGT